MLLLQQLLAAVDEPVRFLGIKLINPEDFFELIIRFTFNLLVVHILVRHIYFPVARRKEYFFNYMLISVILFLMTYMLINVKDLSVGVALGLSVINALVTKKISYAEIIFINIIVLIAAWYGERFWFSSRMSRKSITYEKIDLIRPGRREELLADLRKRTGLDITRIEIGKIDFLRDVVQIRIFYTHQENAPFVEEDDDFNGNGD